MNVLAKIEAVANELDFHRIRMVMEYTEWGWPNDEGNIRVPTQMELYAASIELLQEAYEGFDNTPCPYWVARGGLRAYCRLEDGEYQFRVAFELTDAGDFV